MDLAQLFIPFLQFTGIYITSFWSGGFTTPTAVNQRNWNLGNSIFVHFEITFLTTLTGILDFANLLFQFNFNWDFFPVQTRKKIKLDISNWRKSKFHPEDCVVCLWIDWLLRKLTALTVLDHNRKTNVKVLIKPFDFQARRNKISYILAWKKRKQQSLDMGLRTSQNWDSGFWSI